MIEYFYRQPRRLIAVGPILTIFFGIALLNIIVDRIFPVALIALGISAIIYEAYRPEKIWKVNAESVQAGNIIINSSDVCRVQRDGGEENYYVVLTRDQKRCSSKPLIYHARKKSLALP